MKFSEYADNGHIYLDDKYLCSFNLSTQIPEYLFILATIFNVIKWMQLSNRYNKF